jgi:hypothetical protein
LLLGALFLLRLLGFLASFPLPFVLAPFIAHDKHSLK